VTNPVREFKGTRDQCHDWLLNHGFMYDRGKFTHPKMICTVMHEKHGDFIEEVQDWDRPAFIARVYKR
jgi:hypothetical protein